MAVSQEFKNNWLACQEEYGKNIEGGDIPVLPPAFIDSLRALSESASQGV